MTIHRDVLNHTYVTVDARAAQDYWWILTVAVEGERAMAREYPRYEYANLAFYVRGKCVAGLLSHRSNRMQWRRHCMIERRLLKQISPPTIQKAGTG